MVSRRAEQISTRRRWTLMVGFCCILLAASVGFFLAGPTVTHASTSSAEYQFDLLKGKLPIGVSVPTTALVDVGFASPQDGFALAVHRGDVFLAATTDGGMTWQVRSEDLPSGLGADDGYPGQFEFIGSTGYLWGDRSAELAPLWVSHDDGATWHVAHLGPYVIDASAIGSNVWALTSTCPATTATATTPCSIGLEQSVDEGNTWTPLNVPVLNGSLAAGSGVQAMELARITSTRAYVLTTSQASPTALVHWQLSFTADSGATWTSRLVPCGGPFALGAEVAASSTDDLWLLCGSQASAGEQSKQLFRSSDGGATWSLVAAAVGSGHQHRRPSLPTRYPSPATSHRSPSVTGISRSPRPKRPGSSRRGRVSTSRRTVERAGIRFPSSPPPGSPAAAKETSRSSVRLTVGSAPTASGSGRRRTGSTGIPSARADACGPACPLGRRAHRLCAAPLLRRPRARGPSASAASSGAPSCAVARCASANPRVCPGWATSAISSRSRTRVGELRSPGVSERRAVEFVWCASATAVQNDAALGGPTNRALVRLGVGEAADGAAGGDRLPLGAATRARRMRRTP